MKLLLATMNNGKLKEMQALLEGLAIELATPGELGLDLDVAEDGDTYAENAARKALAFAAAAGLPALADDSGLEVDALDGQPGLHSHRFAPQPQATDADRRALLLQRLAGQPRPWKAHFHCTAALAGPDGSLRFAEGDCPGEIIPEELGDNGFGYDPIFMLSELGKTMAELSMVEKNRLSHRARAVNATIPLIKEMLER